MKNGTHCDERSTTPSSGVPRSRFGPVFRWCVPERSSSRTTRRRWTSWLYRQYRHAQSTGQSLGRLVDARWGMYGHGQFCHFVSHVKTSRSIGLVDASFPGVREQWSRHTGRGQSSVRSLRADVLDTHERRRRLGHVHEHF